MGKQLLKIEWSAGAPLAEYFRADERLPIPSDLVGAAAFQRDKAPGPRGRYGLGQPPFYNQW
jgi:hypothetical protein